MTGITLATASEFLDHGKAGSLAREVWEEDQVLRLALEQRGFQVERRAWSEVSGPGLVLLRCAWDYTDRLDEFRQWLDHMEETSILVNPPGLVRWNLEKRYLLELPSRGIATVETLVIEQHEVPDWSTLFARPGWDQIVLKPLVAASGRNTVLLPPDSLDQEALSRWIEQEAHIVQPFRREILDSGEVSLMVIGDQVTHAVRKTAGDGEFRVQSDHGGSVQPHAPSDDEVAFARATVAACDPPPAYARVDIIRASDGGLLLMELELIEPEFFYRRHPPAAVELAKWLQQNCG